ncbi:O-antigen ligase family protein [Clostridium senegalense]
MLKRVGDNMNKTSKLLYYLICIYVLILPIINDKLGIIGKVPDIILMLIIFIYAIYSLKNKNNRKKLYSNLNNFITSFLGISIIVLAIVMAFSIIYSAEKGLALKETFRFITYIALLFIVKYEVKEKKSIETIINYFVFTTSILCVYGVIQYFTKIGLNPIFISSEGTRITSTMENPNGLGAYLVLSFFPIFMLIFNENNKKSKVFYIITSLLIVINIFLTYSRNATVGFMIGLLVLAFLYNYKFLSVFIIFVPIVLFDKSLINRFSNIKTSVLNDPRIKLWKVAGKMIKENPILGVGNGNYVALYDQYIEKYPELKYKDYHRFSSHNSYLKIQSELGILGIISFALVIISSIRSVIKVYKNSHNKMYKLFFMGVMASIIAFLAMNFLDNLFFSPQTTTYFWLFIALSESILFNDLKIYN